MNKHALLFFFITSWESIDAVFILPLRENKALRMICPWKQPGSLQTCMVISFLLAVFSVAYGALRLNMHALL